MFHAVDDVLHEIQDPQGIRQLRHHHLRYM